MFDITYNGKTAKSLGINITKRPDVPSPNKKIKSIDIPGRDGKLIEFNGEYEDIDIKVDMNFVSSPDEIGERFRNLKKWILGNNGKLSFSDDTSIFYKVKYAEVGNLKREAREGASVLVTFTCDPYTYFANGEVAQVLKNTLNNPYETSHPIYKIVGEGMCTLTVNGKTVKANVGQNLTIDTERMLAYRQDGTLMNTSLSGDYENLYLKPGDNKISVSSNFVTTIIPNWRCL